MNSGLVATSNRGGSDESFPGPSSDGEVKQRYTQRFHLHSLEIPLNKFSIGLDTIPAQLQLYGISAQSYNYLLPPELVASEVCLAEEGRAY